MAAGRLHRLHRGVYAVGHTALTRESRLLAAVMAAHPSALSHRAAGARLGLFTSAAPIEVTTTRRVRLEGVVVHRTRWLPESHITHDDGIPVTTPGRTLVDMAEVLDERRMATAVHEAEVRRVFDLQAIEEVLHGLPGRSGRHRLLRAVAAYGDGPARTRNEAERMFLELCRHHDLPVPQANAPVGGCELDFLWPRAALAVELDGQGAHLTRRAFHEDRRRDRRLAAAHGIQVLRVTWLDLADPASLAEELRDALARRAG